MQMAFAKGAFEVPLKTFTASCSRVSPKQKATDTGGFVWGDSNSEPGSRKMNFGGLELLFPGGRFRQFQHPVRQRLRGLFATELLVGFAVFRIFQAEDGQREQRCVDRAGLADR